MSKSSPWHRVLICIVAFCLSGQPISAQEPSKDEAEQALAKAVTFFRENCSAHGGYVFRLSADLSLREGEGIVGPDTAWLEPPATPAVGMAYVEAYWLTKSPQLLQAALDTADALIRGQLQSGGWDNHIDFAPEARKRYAYRVDDGSSGRKSNTTTYDDDKSQSAIRFLMQLDQTLNFENARVHECVTYALDATLSAQYPNGAWPQRFSQSYDPAEFPVKPASFPETWSRTFPGVDYKNFYTLNDNTITDLITTMLDTYDVYGDEKYLHSAIKGGEFFLLAQLPEPQPGWAQQYNRDMQPAWARKFEPPGITGSESQKVMQALITLYRRTGDEKFLKPIPRAVEFYRTLTLPEGGLARFYEIGTNRPLYFTRKYELVYTDDDLPTHYGFKVGSSLDRIERDYQKWKETPTDKLWSPPSNKRPKASPELARNARKVIDALDNRGAWVEPGKMSYHPAGSADKIIQSSTFAKNLLTLANFIAAAK